MQPELDIVKYRELFEQSDILEGSRDALFVDFDCAAVLVSFSPSRKKFPSVGL